MLSVSSTTRIFVHALPTDMRKSFDGLYALVVHSFGKDIFQGDYFVFVNRTRDRCKVLFWDRDGLVVWAKRLEQGSFQLPGGALDGSLTIEVDSTTLTLTEDREKLRQRLEELEAVNKRLVDMLWGGARNAVRSLRTSSTWTSGTSPPILPPPRSKAS
jgi:transposase